ncbi:hypothetical protein ACFX2H_009773 [Malus domestica]
MADIIMIELIIGIFKPHPSRTLQSSAFSGYDFMEKESLVDRDNEDKESLELNDLLQCRMACSSKELFLCCTVLTCPVLEVLVQHLPPHYPNVLVRLQGLPDVHCHVRRRYHLHLGDAAVDNAQQEVELAYHAERDDTAAGLAVVYFSLDEEHLDAALGESFCSSSPIRTGFVRDDRDEKLGLTIELAFIGQTFKWLEGSQAALEGVELQNSTLVCSTH